MKNKVPFRFQSKPEARLRHERQRHLLGDADARGNNPHGTREPSELEGRRLNAQRYETVGQLDRALDRRLGEVPAAPSGDGFFGKALLLALAAGAVYLLGRGSSPRDDDEGDFDELEEPRQLRLNPAPVPQGQPIVVRIETPARWVETRESGAVVVPSTPPTVVPVVDVPVPAAPVVIAAAVEKPKRRRKLGPNKGQFTSRTGRAARKLVEHPGPKPKVEGLV